MKMLIADDDIATIDMIKQICDWSKLGIDLILCAYNGVVACEIIENEKPDIVLCDIGMPLSSGMDVLKWVHDNKLDTEFIFITCYASFEYARDAVQYGASNYLTKPFTPQEIISVVEIAVNRIEIRRHSSDSAGRKRFTTNMLLNNIYKGGFGTDRDRINSMLSQWDCGFTADDEFRPVYATVDKTNIHNHEWRIETFQYAFRHLALEAIANQLYFDLGLDNWDGPYYTVIVFVPVQRFNEHELVERCKSFVVDCEQHLHCSPVCVVGEAIPFYLTHPTCVDIGKLSRKARFLIGKTLLYRDKSALLLNENYDLNKELLHDALQRKNKTSLVEYIGSIVNDAMQKNIQSDELFHQIHQDLLQVFYANLHENNLEAHILFKSDAMRELNDHAERSALDLMRFVGGLFDSLVLALESVSMPSGIIASIKKYIHENYQEDINREDIAAFVYITPNYLSKLFRSETGLTLREYINTCRIKEAKRLLTNTSLSISEIALDTGFENMSYFSTVFKKICGVGPLAWRNGES